jgi:hypothetical protein
MTLPINTTDLVNQMRANLVEIDQQIASAKRYIEHNYRPLGETPPPDFIYRAQYPSGEFILAGLLTSRANLLAGIANLQASQTAARTPRR